MKVTEKQLLVMIVILNESLQIHGHFSISNETRLTLLNKIYNQQSDEAKDMDE